MPLPTKKTEVVRSLNQLNTFIYGVPKAGKTTFCSSIPHALFAATERGHTQLSVFKEDIGSWLDFKKMIKALKEEKHEFKCVIIDVADHLYSYCEDFICQQNGVKHVSDLPFGKGYALVKKEFIHAVLVLNSLNLGVIFVAHAKEREMKTKTQTYTYMDSSLSQATSNTISGICDFILFFYINEDGKRVIRTKPTKYINAGDRTGNLPELMEMDYSKFEKTFMGLK